LPIARALDPSGGSVIALDPSRSMLDGLLEIAEDYAVENVRTIEARWPLDNERAVADFEADVTLIAHVGYDILEIGPFLDAMERSASRLCVAMLTDQSPASVANLSSSGCCGDGEGIGIGKGSGWRQVVLDNRAGFARGHGFREAEANVGVVSRTKPLGKRSVFH
jgi:hypothetical protein